MTNNPTTQDNVRTVFWEDGQVCMIDQTVLPHTFAIQRYDSYQQVADAIFTMVVRGAPAIGAAAGFGMAIAAQKSTAMTVESLRADLKIAGEVLAKSRPTAVNLFWAIERMLNFSAGGEFESVERLKAALLEEAQRIADDDVAINQRMGAFGAALVPEKATIIHHCNTGSLATVDWGTALGVVRSAFYAEKEIFVLVDETRPRLQGARLTAWELQRAGIAHKVIADGASGHYMRRHGVDLCLVGADRIAANGDTANKIGTYNLAVVAKENNVPFYVVAPTSTIDFRTPTGDDIEIEERTAREVTHIGDSLITPEGVDAGNPAFDVTPARYITAIVTEKGVVYPPFEANLRALLTGASVQPTPTPQSTFIARHNALRAQPRRYPTQPEFEGKVALVTGAASGIGRATAEAFQARGAAVVALDINPDVESLFGTPGTKGIICDLTDTAAISAAVDEAVGLFGGLDILVSNAGIFPASAKIEAMDAALWDRSLQVNLTSHQRVMQACIPHLKNGIDPTILVIGSKNYPAPGPGAAAYSVAKAGLTQLARVAALELAASGIRVNVVHPDAVFDTGIWTPEILAKRAEHYKLSVEEYKTKNLLGVEIGSHDVAELVCVMAGRAFSRTTGAQVPIDGGNDRVI